MKEWYSVKGLFRWYFKSGGGTARIEECIVLFLAGDANEALDLAEQEATTYCTDDHPANFRIEPVGWWHAYWLGNEPASGVEVFSRSAITRLGSAAFLKRYYPKSHRQAECRLPNSKSPRSTPR